MKEYVSRTKRTDFTSIQTLSGDNTGPFMTFSVRTSLQVPAQDFPTLECPFQPFPGLRMAVTPPKRRGRHSPPSWSSRGFCFDHMQLRRPSRTNQTLRGDSRRALSWKTCRHDAWAGLSVPSTEIASQGHAQRHLQLPKSSILAQFSIIKADSDWCGSLTQAQQTQELFCIAAGKVRDRRSQMQKAVFRSSLLCLALWIQILKCLSRLRSAVVLSCPTASPTTRRRLALLRRWTDGDPTSQTTGWDSTLDMMEKWWYPSSGYFCSVKYLVRGVELSQADTFTPIQDVVVVCGVHVMLHSCFLLGFWVRMSSYHNQVFSICALLVFHGSCKYGVSVHLLSMSVSGSLQTKLLFAYRMSSRASWFFMLSQGNQSAEPAHQQAAVHHLALWSFSAWSLSTSCLCEINTLDMRIGSCFCCLSLFQMLRRQPVFMSHDF